MLDLESEEEEIPLVRKEKKTQGSSFLLQIEEKHEILNKQLGDLDKKREALLSELNELGGFLEWRKRGTIVVDRKLECSKTVKE